MHGWSRIAGREQEAGKAPRVLLVDDSGFNLKAATLLLESVGYEVVSTNTSVGLGPLMLREKPDLVLVDVEMPEMRGDSVVKAARRLLKDRCCPMLLWSSLPVDELADLARSSGAAGYIYKSGGREMVAKIAEVLGHGVRSRGLSGDEGNYMATHSLPGTHSFSSYSVAPLEAAPLA